MYANMQACMCAFSSHVLNLLVCINFMYASVCILCDYILFRRSTQRNGCTREWWTYWYFKFPLNDGCCEGN